MTRAAWSWLSSIQPSLHQDVSPAQAQSCLGPEDPDTAALGEGVPEEWGQASRGAACAKAWTCNCVGLPQNECGRFKQELSFQGPGASISCKQGVRALCWPYCSLHLRLRRLPATGSGNQMSIKGGVSNLGGPPVLIHPCLADGGRRPCVGQGACTEQEFRVLNPTPGVER